MSNVHGRPGMYATTQAERSLFRVLVIVFGSMLIFGFIAGAAVFGPSPWLGVLAVVVAFAALWAAERVTRKRVDRLRRDRLNYVRGGNGEELVGSLLESLDSDWHVFHGIKLDPNSDIDHVLVGNAGIYCVSTKNVRGLFSASDDELLYNGKPTSYGRQAVAQAMNIRDRLAALMGGPPPYVNAILAVPQAWVELPPVHRNVRVLHQDNLVTTLEGAPHRMNKDQVAACAKALELLMTSAVDVRVSARRAGIATTPGGTSSTQPRPDQAVRHDPPKTR